MRFFKIWLGKRAHSFLYSIIVVVFGLIYISVIRITYSYYLISIKDGLSLLLDLTITIIAAAYKH